MHNFSSAIATKNILTLMLSAALIGGGVGGLAGCGKGKDAQTLIADVKAK
jgi:hypothetical protein